MTLKKNQNIRRVTLVSRNEAKSAPAHEQQHGQVHCGQQGQAWPGMSQEIKCTYLK